MVIIPVNSVLKTTHQKSFPSSWSHLNPPFCYSFLPVSGISYSNLISVSLCTFDLDSTKHVELLFSVLLSCPSSGAHWDFADCSQLPSGAPYGACLQVVQTWLPKTESFLITSLLAQSSNHADSIVFLTQFSNSVSPSWIKVSFTQIK